jgi:hypothetical protein
MNKRIDLSNNGGFPATQDTLSFMQDSYRDALKGIAKLCGDKSIIDGVVVNAGVVSNGWISYNGELIPFVGGLFSAGVVIQETATKAVFQDLVERDAYFTKVAFCGGPATFQFSDLKKLTTLQEVWLVGDIKEVDCTAEYIADNFDSTGLGINERIGWAICNGQNGTKNRGGRVGIGYSTVTDDPLDNVWENTYNNIGATGGEKEHTLTINEIPEHDHTVRKNGFLNKGGGDGTNVIGSEIGSNQLKTGFAGGGEAHENRMPFIVSLFIQKI